jgi:hypothetical protein
MPRSFFPHDFSKPGFNELPGDRTNDSRAGGARTRGNSGGIAPVSLTAEQRGFSTHAAGSGSRAPAPQSYRHNPEVMPHLYKGDSYRLVDVEGVGSYFVLGTKTAKGFFADGVKTLYKRDASTGIYMDTGMKARLDNHGRWVPDAAQSAHAASSSSQADTSGASSSHATSADDVVEPAQPGSSVAASSTTETGAKRNVLESILGKAKSYDPVHQFWLGRGKYGKPFHEFDGKNLLVRKRVASDVPNKLQDNRIHVAKLVQSIFSELGYRVELDDKNVDRIRLIVTNPNTEIPFLVYIKLSSYGGFKPLTDPPRGQSYMFAAVTDDVWSGKLKTLHLIPIKGDAPGAGQPSSANQPAPLW